MSHHDELGLRVERCLDRLGIDVSLRGSNPGQRDDPSLLESPQRSTHRVMLQVGGDNVVAGLDQPLDGQVQPIGAVVREDPAARVLCPPKS